MGLMLIIFGRIYRVIFTAEQIITSEGNFAKISLSVTLFDIKEQKILENEFFEVLVVLEDLQMNTLIVGFERGLNELCDKIIAWLTKFS
ncbi:hypothetical protein NYG92_07315 [Campylobacter felis]|uniref:hypothetical protein n=1 Tax=Campylobacter felis TaxID=2974565 RepID=UPI002561EE6D|nr:hypothetical protein [Campylobacter felis]MDL0110557.1 hypothetical protein [Campylobacter felis]